MTNGSGNKCAYLGESVVADETFECERVTLCECRTSSSDSIPDVPFDFDQTLGFADIIERRGRGQRQALMSNMIAAVIRNSFDFRLRAE